MKTFVIIPGLNEEKYLPKVLEKVFLKTKNIIFVDDGSTDRSAAIARRYTQHVLKHSINLGKGAALKTGCEYAFDVLQADAVIFMDADDQHDPDEISDFLAELKKGSAVVFGTRALDAEMPLLRLVGNKLASVCMGFLFGAFIPDIPSGYKALSKKGYEAVKWNSTGYEVEMEIAAKVGKARLPFSLIPIKTIYHDKDKGMNALDALYIFSKIPIWRMNK